VNKKYLETWCYVCLCILMTIYNKTAFLYTSDFWCMTFSNNVERFLLWGGDDNFRSSSVTRNKMPVSNSKVQSVHDIANATTLIWFYIYIKGIIHINTIWSSKSNQQISLALILGMFMAVNFMTKTKYFSRKVDFAS
jgi:hypothetical protein